MNSGKLKVGGIGAGVVGSILSAHLAEAGGIDKSKLDYALSKVFELVKKR